MNRDFRRNKFRRRHFYIDVGILTRNPDSWEISTCNGISLCPRLFLSDGRFKRFEDASEFARFRYADAFYPWEIRHISRVISKEEVLAMVLKGE